MGSRPVSRRGVARRRDGRVVAGHAAGAAALGDAGCLHRAAGHARSGGVHGEVRVLSRSDPGWRPGAAAHRRRLHPRLGRTGRDLVNKISAHDAGQRSGKAHPSAVGRHRRLHAAGRKISRRTDRARRRRRRAEADHDSGAGRRPRPAGVDRGVRRLFPPVGNMAQLMRGMLFPTSNLIFNVQKRIRERHGRRTDERGRVLLGRLGSRHLYRMGTGRLRGGALAESAPLMLTPGAAARTASWFRSTTPTGSSSPWSWPRRARPRSKPHRRGSRTWSARSPTRSPRRARTATRRIATSRCADREIRSTRRTRRRGACGDYPSLRRVRLQAARDAVRLKPDTTYKRVELGP